MGHDNKIYRKPGVYNGIVKNCVVKLNKIKYPTESGDFNISLLNLQKTCGPKASGNERFDGDTIVNNVKFNQEKCTQKYQTAQDNNKQSPRDLSNVKKSPKNIAVENTRDHDEDLNKSQKGLTISELNDSRSKRYKVKIDSGNISFTVAEDYTHDLKQEEKENIQQTSEQSKEIKLHTNLRRSSRKSAAKTEARKSQRQDIYKFDSEAIVDEDDITADVIQKIIREGKAAVVKYRYQVPKKKTARKKTSDILQGIKRNLLKSRNVLAERLKTKTQNELADANANIVDDSYHFTDETRNQEFQYFDDSEVGDQISKAAPSEIVAPESSNQEAHDVSTKAKGTTAALNPAKAIKVLEVIYLPNRATVQRSTTPLKQVELSSNGNAQTFFSIPDDTGLDITHSNYFDFLAKLEGEKPGTDEHILREKNEEQSSSIEDTNKEDNFVENNVLEELDDREVDVGQNDSLFPDVNVMPYFDTRVQRRTYSRTPKHRDRRTRFFILLSDEGQKSEEKEHTKHSTPDVDKAQRTKGQTLDDTVEKITVEIGSRDGSEELNEKENVKPEPKKRKRKIEHGVEESPRSSKRIKLGPVIGENKSYKRSVNLRPRLLRL